METPKHYYHYYLTTEQPEGQPQSLLIAEDSEEAALARIIEEIGPGDWKMWPQGSGDVSNTDCKHGIRHVTMAEKLPPMKSANDLYAMEPLRVTKDPYAFHSSLHEMERDRIPETTDPETDLDVSANTRVEARYLYDPYIDGYRVSELYTLWFDDKPFAVCQEAGRSGQDHRARYITDAKVFGEALGYLVSLYVYEEVGETPEVIDPTVPRRDLTTFYGSGDAFDE